MFKSTSEITGKLSDLRMPCDKEMFAISSSAECSIPIAQSKATSNQGEPGPESMELAIAFHVPSVSLKASLLPIFKNGMSLRTQKMARYQTSPGVSPNFKGLNFL